MQRFNGNIQDSNGNAINSASITVTDNNGGAVTIYSTNATSNPITQPFTPASQGSSLGEFYFYAANGRYNVTATYAVGSYAESDVLLFDDSVGISTLQGGGVGTILYQSAANTTAFLPANTTTTPEFVTSTGTGTVGQSPVLTSSTGSGKVVLDTAPTIGGTVTLTGGINYSRSTVASATTPDIWTGTSNVINYTGNTTATGFAAAPQAGVCRLLDCASSAPFTAGPNMLIDGVTSGTTIIVTPGDRIEVFARTTTQFVLRWLESVNTTSTTKQFNLFPLQNPSVGANALTVGVNATSIDFRDGTLANGVVTTENIPSLTLTVPSGATLGTINNILARLFILVAYNAGTPVLCIVNEAGGLNLDETTLISPTTISGTANSNNVIYSASSVSANSPFRVVGYVEITEATAGTWTTAPSLAQSAGGQQPTLGIGQTWQDVTASRLVATTYYNLTNKPISVSIVGTQSANPGRFYLVINGVHVSDYEINATGTWTGSISGIVPPLGSYSVTASNMTINYWTELR